MDFTDDVCLRDGTSDTMDNQLILITADQINSGSTSKECSERNLQPSTSTILDLVSDEVVSIFILPNTLLKCSVIFSNILRSSSFKY